MFTNLGYLLIAVLLVLVVYNFREYRIYKRLARERSQIMLSMLILDIFVKQHNEGEYEKATLEMYRLVREHNLECIDKGLDCLSIEER